MPDNSAATCSIRQGMVCDLARRSEGEEKGRRKRKDQFCIGIRRCQKPYQAKLVCDSKYLQ